MIDVHLTAADMGAPVNCMRGLRATMRALVNANEGDGDSVTMADAQRMWQAWQESAPKPLRIGAAPTMEQAKEAVEAGVEASNARLGLGWGLSAEQLLAVEQGHPDPMSVVADADGVNGLTPTPPQEAPEARSSGPSPSLVPPEADPDDPWTISPELHLLAPDPRESPDYYPSPEVIKAALLLLGQCEGNSMAALSWATTYAHHTGDSLWAEVAWLYRTAFPLDAGIKRAMRNPFSG